MSDETTSGSSDRGTRKGLTLFLAVTMWGTWAGDVAADTFYVDNNPAITTHDGTSWATAYADLQQALAAATGAGAGDEIRVADGTYKPTSGTDRTLSFQLKNGVAVRGGYAGSGAVDPDQRGFVSTLSGDIGSAGDFFDNSYHVVVGSGTDATAVLDGFTVYFGFANGSMNNQDKGAGMFNNVGSPTVINCIFSGNAAPNGGGGGMYNHAYSPAFSSPALINCTFTGNLGNSGGAMYNSYNSSPTLTNCAFTNNTTSAGGSGGGMYSEFGAGPALADCTFSGNSAAKGAGMTLYYANNDLAMLTNCSFIGNNADESGGGMYNNSNSSPELTDCTFTDNTAANGHGGGMYNIRGSSPVLIDCGFSGNEAPNGSGGGMYNAPDPGPEPPNPSSPTLTRVTFSNNSANLGGGMYNKILSVPTLTDCAFYDNAANSGGGMYNSDRCSPELTNCTFSNNSTSAGGSGGGMYSHHLCQPVLDNCNFTGNVAAYGGGGMYNADLSGGTLTDCGFTGGNTADRGGGMYCTDTSSPLLTRCMFNGNVGDIAGGGMYVVGSNPGLTDCTFSGNSGAGGGGMYSSTSGPSLLRCTFSDNTTTGDGGAISHTGSSLSGIGISGCTFTRNSAAGNGGGLYDGTSSSATISGCRFMGNSAGSSGGGIGNSSATATLVNCLFSGNSAGFGGGVGSGSSSLTMTNCTFSANSADIEGGALANYNSGSPSVRNCILWGDSAPSFSEIKNVSSSPVLTFSAIVGGYPGSGNINADPLFVRNPDPGLDLAWGTDDDDYGDLRLRSGSPCLDAGFNTAVAGTVDLAGNPRRVDDAATLDCPQAPGTCGTAPIIDMGAYEGSVCVCLGDMNGDGEKNGLDIQGLVNCLMVGGSCECADVDQVDGVSLDDVAVFSTDLLAGGTCP